MKKEPKIFGQRLSLLLSGVRAYPTAPERIRHHLTDC